MASDVPQLQIDNIVVVPLECFHYCNGAMICKRRRSVAARQPIGAQLTGKVDADRQFVVGCEKSFGVSLCTQQVSVGRFNSHVRRTQTLMSDVFLCLAVSVEPHATHSRRKSTRDCCARTQHTHFLPNSIVTNNEHLCTCVNSQTRIRQKPQQSIHQSAFLSLFKTIPTLYKCCCFSDSAAASVVTVSNTGARAG